MSNIFRDSEYLGVSDLNIFVRKWSKIAKKNTKKMAEFAWQNLVETTLSDGLETSEQKRAY